MVYFKIDGTDLSHYVNELKIATKTNYSAQTNALGDTVVDKINNKREIEVGIIPLDELEAQVILSLLDRFVVTIEVREPKTGALASILAMIPESDVDYYTIQADKVKLNAFKLKFTEL